MTTDDKQTLALLSLGVVAVVQSWLLWRMSQVCRLLAGNHVNLAKLVRRLAEHARNEAEKP